MIAFGFPYLKVLQSGWTNILFCFLLSKIWIVIKHLNVNCNILDCNIVEFKVLKLTVNCLSLISFESRIRKKILIFKFGDILHISAKLQGDICKMSC